MSKKIKVLLSILIIIFITIIYNYGFRSKVEYEKNNTPSERQYRKENADKLLKSSNYKEFYVDIYREDKGVILVDDYSTSSYRDHFDIDRLTISKTDDIKPENIEILWEDLNEKSVRLIINIKINGELKRHFTIDYY